jgi:hypothetical protein
MAALFLYGDCAYLTRLAQRWRSHELPPKDFIHQPKQAEVDDKPD